MGEQDERLDSACYLQRRSDEARAWALAIPASDLRSLLFEIAEVYQRLARRRRRWKSAPS